jgi:WD40 repeat protein
MLDPQTGAILSSLRTSADLSGKTGMGISSLSTFPSSFSMLNSNTNNITIPTIAYGGNSAKKGDNYAMLISIRTSTSPPIMHWKCRLPETEMTGGVILSPCGYYVVGGGGSGSCYIWSSLEGKLLRTFKAHYRSCSCLEWSDCGRYLVTGGTDGMVHMFSMLDLVNTHSRNPHRSVSPLQTFSIHHYPVTSLVQLPSGRVASTSEDGQLLVLELFSKAELLNVHLPHGIRSMTHDDGRLFLGSIQGTVYSIDINAYAMHQTERLGVVFANRRLQVQRDGGTRTMEETVFGTKQNIDNTTATMAYQTDWVGHDCPVTSIALINPDGDQRLLITGDESGQIRIWHLESRTCLNVLNPWSQMAGPNTNKSRAASGPKTSISSHPITSICIIPQLNDASYSAMFRTPQSHDKNTANISSLIPPLQKFVEGEDTRSSVVLIPFLSPSRTAQDLHCWEAKPVLRKRRRNRQGGDEKHHISNRNDREGEASVDQSNQETVAMAFRIKQLEEQLRTKQSEVERWETVNNKLMAKLQSRK